MTIHRVKVSFKDEPGEGSGVARSFYTALSEALLSGEKLPAMDLNRSEYRNSKYSIQVLLNLTQERIKVEGRGSYLSSVLLIVLS